MLRRPSHPGALRVSFKKALSRNLRNGRQWGLSLFPKCCRSVIASRTATSKNSPAGSFLTTAAARKPLQL